MKFRDDKWLGAWHCGIWQRETSNGSETFPHALGGTWIGFFFSIKDHVCIINVIRFPYRGVCYWQLQGRYSQGRIQHAIRCLQCLLRSVLPLVDILFYYPGFTPTYNSGLSIPFPLFVNGQLCRWNVSEWPNSWISSIGTPLASAKHPLWLKVCMLHRQSHDWDVSGQKSHNFPYFSCSWIPES